MLCRYARTSLKDCEPKALLIEATCNLASLRQQMATKKTTGRSRIPTAALTASDCAFAGGGRRTSPTGMLRSGANATAPPTAGPNI
jgi:hypothetical protein